MHFLLAKTALPRDNRQASQKIIHKTTLQNNWPGTTAEWHGARVKLHSVNKLFWQNTDLHSVTIFITDWVSTSSQAHSSHTSKSIWPVSTTLYSSRQNGICIKCAYRGEKAKYRHEGDACSKLSITRKASVRHVRNRLFLKLCLSRRQYFVHYSFSCFAF